MRIIHTVILLIIIPICAFGVPATPTKAPIAHPLAPNSHTSIGILWTYLDANTGRSWTGGTYKVKRCQGNDCTPTTVIATGLTNPDFQDSGLSSNTIYCYAYLANDGADSGNSPKTCRATETTDTNFVVFPDTKWANIFGTLAESSQIPYAYYTNVMTTQAQEMIAKFPVVGPTRAQGTASTTSGSNIVTGTGTFFLEQIAANNPTCLNAISINGVNMGAIASVNSNTQITLAANAPSSQSGIISTNISGLCGFSDPLSDYLTGNQLGYYDSPFAMWQVYFMTGDPQYMRGARKYSEALFAALMWNGRNRAWNQFSTTPNTDNLPPPRNFQFTGYLVIGMAGHDGVWDLLDNYLTARYSTWISNYRGGNNNFLFLREKGYMIKFTNQAVIAFPDTFPRSNGTTTSINGTTTVDGDLIDGRKDFWRDQLDIDVPGFILDDQVASGEWYEYGSAAGVSENDFPYPPGTQQPWLAGLVVDALGDCWNNTNLSSTARNAARKMVLRAVAMMVTRGYNTNIAADDTSFRHNHMWYFLGGGTRLNPFMAEHGSDSSLLNTPDNNMKAQYRQGNPFYLAPLAWAWLMSGQTAYKTFGDAIANSTFAAIGENVGGTGDGIKALCDADNNYKDYGQCFRTSAKYFGARLMSASSLGTPPSVTMPTNQTLTGGVNQASLTATVSCTNTPCNYKWYFVEYPLVMARWTPHPVFGDSTSLSTTLSGLENGTYKIGFYALDNLGLMGQGTVTITVGDGVFPPVVVMHKDGGGWNCTTGTSVTGVNVRAFSAAGRTLSHSFSVASKPKDASTPTITPSGTVGNILTFSVANLTTTSSSWYVIKNIVTDSAGTSRTAFFVISKHSTCGNFTQPSSAHNTIPVVNLPKNHILPLGSTSTKLYIAPIDPEGSVSFVGSATGYVQNIDGIWVVNALTHLWTQTGGPVTATITNGNTLQPTITGLTQTGTYTFQYSGTDAQSDTVTENVTVTVQAASGNRKCNWHANPPCNP